MNFEQTLQHEKLRTDFYCGGPGSGRHKEATDELKNKALRKIEVKEDRLAEKIFKSIGKSRTVLTIR